jgi:hypothetical protein
MSRFLREPLVDSSCDAAIALVTHSKGILRLKEVKGKYHYTLNGRVLESRLRRVSSMPVDLEWVAVSSAGDSLDDSP